MRRPSSNTPHPPIPSLASGRQRSCCISRRIQALNSIPDQCKFRLSALTTSLPLLQRLRRFLLLFTFSMPMFNALRRRGRLRTSRCVRLVCYIIHEEK